MEDGGVDHAVAMATSNGEAAFRSRRLSRAGSCDPSYALRERIARHITNRKGTSGYGNKVMRIGGDRRTALPHALRVGRRQNGAMYLVAVRDKRGVLKDALRWLPPRQFHVQLRSAVVGASGKRGKLEQR
ncbi:hypothetical protein MRX96_027708 [Rhipicephalus microplus]